MKRWAAQDRFVKVMDGHLCQVDQYIFLLYFGSFEGPESHFPAIRIDLVRCSSTFASDFDGWLWTVSS